MATTRTNYNRKHYPSQEIQSLTKRQSDRYSSQTKIHKQWEAEMKRLITKYNLDCFSDSELDLESDEGEAV